MYTGKYDNEEPKMAIPEGYDGSAFMHHPEDLHTEGEECKIKEDSPSFFQKGGKGIFEIFSGGIPGLPKFKPPRGMEFGTEEVMIIALAAVMLFSGSDLMLCAMLILLIFI